MQGKRQNENDNFPTQRFENEIQRDILNGNSEVFQNKHFFLLGFHSGLDGCVKMTVVEWQPDHGTKTNINFTA